MLAESQAQRCKEPYAEFLGVPEGCWVLRSCVLRYWDTHWSAKDPQSPLLGSQQLWKSLYLTFQGKLGMSFRDPKVTQLWFQRSPCGQEQ